MVDLKSLLLLLLLIFFLRYCGVSDMAWTIETVDSNGIVGLYNSLALDSSDYPCISYYDETNDDLKYAKWNGSSWDIETVDSVGSVGYYTSIALVSQSRSNTLHSLYIPARSIPFGILEIMISVIKI